MIKYHKDTESLIEKAKEICVEYSRRHICEDILFNAFFPISNLSTSLLLDRLGVPEYELHEYSEIVLQDLKKHKAAKTVFSPKVKNLISEAEQLAEEDGELMPHHIFAAFCVAMPKVFVEYFDIQAEEVFQAYLDFSGDVPYDTALSAQPERLPMFDGHPILDKFAENVNLQAKNGEFDNIVDFDNKVEEITTILCKRQKPNPILVGQAGCGKTSVVGLLAKRVVEGKVPDLLSDIVIYSLNLSSMVSGTEYRGQFEKRMEDLVKELRKYPNLVVFIDEIHTLVGAGNTQENTLDASNILKVDLARGSIRCIGATTIKEYNSTIKKDAALDRRFEKILVQEPSLSQMKSILPHILTYYSENHAVEYDEEFSNSLLPMCDKYLPNKKYPDKVVDVIDYCGAKVKVGFYNFSGMIKEKKEELLMDCLDNEISQDTILEFCAELQKIGEETLASKPKVTKEHLKDYFLKYKNPIYKLCLDEEKQRRLRKKIIGQSAAFNKFINGLSSHIYGADIVKPKKTPVAFLLYGEKGSGRTFFCDTIANELKLDGANVIRYSGAELPSYHARYKILNEVRDENSLAEQVILNPTSVIIVDGFDDCDLEVKSLFEEILSKGRLNVGFGDVADFANTQIIFTCTNNNSNQTLLGFGSHQKDDGSKPQINLGAFCLEIPLIKPTRKTYRRIIYNYLFCLNKNLKTSSGSQVKFDKGDLIRLAKKADKDKDFLDSMFLEKIPNLVVQEIKNKKKNISLSTIK